MRAQEQRRQQLARLTESLFRLDVEEPAALDEKDREAIGVALGIALEADTVFQRVLRRKGHVQLSEELDHLCDSVRAGIDFFATIKQTAAIIRGVKTRRKSGPLRRLMVEHGKCLKRMGDPKLDLPQRLSVLLELIQLDLLVFAHTW
jgi:hypothetical protein